MKQDRRCLDAACRGWLLASLLAVPLALRASEGPLVLKVRHDHAIGGCQGTLTLDDSGVRYETQDKEDARSWSYEDIKQFQVENKSRITVYTYEDRRWRLGADKPFQFDWQDTEVSPRQVYEFLRTRTRRPIAAWIVPQEPGAVLYEFPVKHLRSVTGSQGRLVFTEQFVVLESDRPEQSRTWRYEDLEGIASAGLYDLALTTYEQQSLHYAARRVYNFQLQQPLAAETYDSLWRFVNRQKGLELFGGQGPRERIRE